MKQLLKRIRNKKHSLLYKLAFYREVYRDSRRYLKSADTTVSPPEHRPIHLEGEIIRRYHIVEKGLTMEPFRPRFGAENIQELVRLIAEGQATTGMPEGATALEDAENALRSYYKRHRQLGVDVDDLVPGEYRDLLAQPSCPAVKPFTGIDPPSRKHFAQALRMRSSLRSFDPDTQPSREQLLRAVETALAAPSVCNRQTGRVHIVTGGKVREVLALQNGNRGFGQHVPVVMVVTSDMRYFLDTIERYQGWIDGGIFAMQLMHGLSAEGLGSVPLNWSVLNDQDQELREMLGIPEHERIIVLIGCGVPHREAMVTASPRRQPRDIIQWHLS